MSATLLDSVNVWRLAAQRRVLTGRLPLAKLLRLKPSLADEAGVVEFSLEFGHLHAGPAMVSISAETALILQCQRTLNPFEFPVRLAAQVAFIRTEADEAQLPPGCEPRLVEADGLVIPAELVEDELILSLPVVALSPRASEEEIVWEQPAPDAESPFAALQALKGHVVDSKE